MSVKLAGSRFLTVDSATTEYPTNGATGAGSTTATDSILETCSKTLLDGFLLLTAHTSATTITIYQHDGTTVVHTLSIALNQACPYYIPLGGPNGLEVPSGIGAKTSNTATTGHLYFRRADSAGYVD